VKNIFLILVVLLFSCQESVDKNQEICNIKKNVFTDMLTQIHLFEASYQLERISDSKKAEKKLAKNYIDLFKEYDISSSDFESCMSLYSNNPDELSLIYSDILENLNQINSNN
tara:strand:+ start:269 stop:607 length:339 start_codon:yes stop_codon:yes gene_type:complete